MHERHAYVKNDPNNIELRTRCMRMQRVRTRSIIAECLYTLYYYHKVMPEKRSPTPADSCYVLCTYRYLDYGFRMVKRAVRYFVVLVPSLLYSPSVKTADPKGCFLTRRGAINIYL
jgi:hypothetical protein